ncbi:hypothetical protein Tco_0549996, partial [Tanacetum coccineum]
MNPIREEKSGRVGIKVVVEVVVGAGVGVVSCGRGEIIDTVGRMVVEVIVKESGMTLQVL